MSTYKHRLLLVSTGMMILLLILTGCVRPEPALETPSQPPQNQNTATPLIPTATMPPMAIQVNGEGVLLADYESELGRLQQAAAELGHTMTAEEQKNTVLSFLIDSCLLAQEAKRTGYTLEDDAVQTRLDELAVKLGGSAALIDWMNMYGYDDASLLRSLKLQMLASRGQELVTATVGNSAEQVHARQIRTSDETAANSYYARLQAGTEFATLANEVDALTGGDLGWFPQGYLLHDELNDVVFTLKPGEYSQVIKTQAGYHIIEVIERDENHPLNSETRLFLQHQALETSLAEQRENAQIKILVP